MIWLHRFYDVLQTETKIAGDAARVTALQQAGRRQVEAIAAHKQAVKDQNTVLTRLKKWLYCAQRAAEIVEKEYEEAIIAIEL